MIELTSILHGSHIWHMDHPGSDRDIVHIYANDSNHIVSEDTPNRSWEDNIPGEDHMHHSLKHHIEQLANGNYNHIVYATSPEILYVNPMYKEEMAKLRQLSLQSFSQKCYDPIRGLAIQNRRKYFERDAGISDDEKQKKLNGMARTLLFGINLLQSGDPQFKAFSGATLETIDFLLKGLEAARDTSPLPKECPNRYQLLDMVSVINLKTLGLARIVA